MKLSLSIPLLFYFSMLVASLAGQVVSDKKAGEDPLPSWNETPAKQAVIDFVNKVTTADTPGFVPVPERIAVLDNDGTLWTEAPIPFQVAFAFDELRRRAPDDPKLAANPMVQAALAGDVGKLLAGKHYDGLMEVLALTHAGITTDEFDTRVKNWLKSAKHPRFNRPYTELTFLPMQELLIYLRANGFKTFIVSGGGADFVRVWSESIYGIPPQNVIGSTGRVKFERRDGVPTLIKTLDQLFVDDKEGKPVGIHHFIGRRPIACFGNSDGDQAMMEYTTINNPHPSLGLIVHHTDAEREYAYDANPKGSGKLTTALEMAPQQGWVVVDMKNDWSQIFTDPGTTNTENKGDAVVGAWKTESIGGEPVLDDAPCSLEVKADGSVSGNSTVNRFNGNATLDGQSIQFGPIAMTRRAGPPAHMDQEMRYMKALGDSVSFRIVDGKLEFLNAAGDVGVRFVK